jgi:hypothetical protein
VFGFKLTPARAVEGVVVALIVGLIGGIFPAVRAARTPIVAGLYGSWQKLTPEGTNRTRRPSNDGRRRGLTRLLFGGCDVTVDRLSGLLRPILLGLKTPAVPRGFPFCAQ